MKSEIRIRGDFLLGIVLIAAVVFPSAAGADPVLLSGVPNYEWFYGCSPTSAGMLIGYYDRNGYNDKGYGNLVQGGKAELNTYDPAYSVDWSAIAHSAIASEEHVDDYWGNPDPLGSDRTLPDEWNCLADFMGTSQGTKANGVTTWHGTTSTKHYVDMCDNGYGLYGLVGYIVNQGYEVDTAYRQAVDEYISGGFTFNDFKSEIDAGRPMLVHVTGHTMLGLGYDDEGAAEDIYVYDTWDAVTGKMTWGGSYSGKTQKAITALRLADYPDMLVGANAPLWYGADDGYTVSLGYGLGYEYFEDCAYPDKENGSIPDYAGSMAGKTGTLVYAEDHGGAWGADGAGAAGQILFDIDNWENLDETKSVWCQFQVRITGDGYFGVSLDTLGQELVTGGTWSWSGATGTG